MKLREISSRPQHMGVSKKRCTILGFPIRRIIVVGDLYWGSPILVNDLLCSNYAVLLLQDAFVDASLAKGVGFGAMSLLDLSMCPLQRHQACTELQSKKRERKQQARTTFKLIPRVQKRSKPHTALCLEESDSVIPTL